MNYCIKTRNIIIYIFIIVLFQMRSLLLKKNDTYNLLNMLEMRDVLIKTYNNDKYNVLILMSRLHFIALFSIFSFDE